MLQRGFVYMLRQPESDQVTRFGAGHRETGGQRCQHLRLAPRQLMTILQVGAVSIKVKSDSMVFTAEVKRTSEATARSRFPTIPPFQSKATEHHNIRYLTCPRLEPYDTLVSHFAAPGDTLTPRKPSQPTAASNLQAHPSHPLAHTIPTSSIVIQSNNHPNDHPHRPPPPRPPPPRNPSHPPRSRLPLNSTLRPRHAHGSRSAVLPLASAENGFVCIRDAR